MSDEITKARLDLSIAEANKPYLHKWVGAKSYPKAKKINDLMASNARKILRDNSKLSLIHI